MGLAPHVGGKAVEPGAVDDRLAQAAGLLAAILEPDAGREPVLVSERQSEVEDVPAAAVAEAVPVEVGRRKPGI